MKGLYRKANRKKSKSVLVENAMLDESGRENYQLSQNAEPGFDSFFEIC